MVCLCVRRYFNSLSNRNSQSHRYLVWTCIHNIGRFHSNEFDLISGFSSLRHLYMCQPVGLSVHRSVHPPVGRFIRPSILRLSINASVCLSVSPSVRSMFVKKDPLSSHSSPSQMNTTNTIISRSQARTKTMQPMTEDSPLAVWALFR